MYLKFSARGSDFHVSKSDAFKLFVCVCVNKRGTEASAIAVE
jgi:hypothetical protein